MGTEHDIDVFEQPSPHHIIAAGQQFFSYTGIQPQSAGQTVFLHQILDNDGRRDINSLTGIMAFTVTRSTELILAQFRGEAIAPLVERHNREFVSSYQRWFEAIYLNKYEYLGDYDLMRLGFVLDLGFYYLGVASQPYKRCLAGLREPIFSSRVSVPFYHLMRTYNRRLASIARARHRRGVWGRHNAGRRFLFGGYTFSPANARPIVQALLCWFCLELQEGWRSWLARKPAPAVRESTNPMTAPVTS